ncbi:Eg45-like domain containing protein [Thalictrum thalictroides]|uniref:Eg45-like domain containing protein n=1 Tax=Thalictrum thalictroides TaxID=46969 RepID=A0A7J6URR9_THATH|nr:Eg45-like domain containing protein [Thalictrum thalictroides]
MSFGTTGQDARMYNVTCTGPTNQDVPQHCGEYSVTVKIVDYYCSAGCAGTMDLSQEAFAMIADPNAGKVNIECKNLW